MENRTIFVLLIVILAMVIPMMMTRLDYLSNIIWDSSTTAAGNDDDEVNKSSPGTGPLFPPIDEGLCEAPGEYCSKGIDCCTRICQPDHQCPCQGLGDKCSSSMDCCHNTCNATAATCDCTPEGMECQDSLECCSGGCIYAAAADGKEFGVCASNCISTGETPLLNQFGFPHRSNRNGCCSVYGVIRRGSDGPFECGRSFPGYGCNMNSDCATTYGFEGLIYCSDRNRCVCYSAGEYCESDWNCCSPYSKNQICNLTTNICEVIESI